jgi:hypothetical protein
MLDTMRAVTGARRLLGAVASVAALIAILLVAAPLLSGCDAPAGTNVQSAAEPDNHPDRAWVVLVDLSGSTKQEQGVRAQYVSLYKSVVDKMERGDSLLMYDISRNSVAEARKLVDLQTQRPTPPAPDSSDTSDTYAASLAAWRASIPPFRDELAPALDPNVISTIENADSQGSDIIGAIGLAQRAFSVDDGEPRLVILSDMLLKEGKVDLGKEASAKKGMAWLAAHPEVLTNLKGARVLVAGAGKSGMTPAHTKTVQDFWMKYFQDSSAQLQPEYYGHELPSTVLSSF